MPAGLTQTQGRVEKAILLQKFRVNNSSFKARRLPGYNLHHQKDANYTKPRVDQKYKSSEDLQCGNIESIGGDGTDEIDQTFCR